MGRIGLGRNHRQQCVDSVPDGAYQRNLHGHPAADSLAPDVDLDDRDVLGIKGAIRKIGTEHDKGVAVFHRPVAGTEANQPGNTYVMWIVVLHEFLAAERVHHWGPQRLRETDQLGVRARAASPSQDRHPAGGVQHLCGCRQGPLVRAHCW